MKSNIFKIVIISIVTVFAATLIGTGYFLYSDYKIGCEAAETRFEKLFNQTEDAISRYGEPTEDFIKAFNKAVGSPEHYYSISLKSGNQDIYQYPNFPQSSSKPFTVTKSRRLTEGNSIDMTLTVSVYTLPSSILYSRFKLAFIIILSATFISALCLFYLYLNSNEDIEEYEDEDFDFSEDDLSDDLFDEKQDIESEISTEPSEDNLDFSLPESESLPDVEFNEPELNDTNTETSSTTEEYTNNLSNESVPAEEKTVNDVPSENTDNSSEPVKVPSDNNALFSEATGFCMEKFLNTRLESELARAASSEIDVSLVLIRIPELNLSEPCGIEICKQILNIFHYRDMIFEYKNDGIAIIFSNADIDKAMECSEQIYAEICSILNQYDKTMKPVFGIASRSLRFISGDRIITEAEQALIHAKEDPESPIIAFRVNPEKYRQYMATKQ